MRTGDAKDLVCGTFVIVEIDVDPKTQVPVGQHSQQSGRDFKASIPTSNPRSNDKSNPEALRQGPPYGQIGGHTREEISDLWFERFARSFTRT